MKDTVRPYPFISEQEKARRKEAIDFARHNVLLEGTVLRPEIEEINEKYVNGELTLKEHGDAVRESAWKLVNG